MPAHTVAALLAGQLKVVVQNLHILVQFGQVAHLVPGQRAVPVGEQLIFKVHHRLHLQPPPGAVVGVVLIVLHRIAQQRQVIAPPQHEIQRLHRAALPDVDVHPLQMHRLFQIIHRRIGRIGRMGQHHPQLRAALLLFLDAPAQAVHIFQHPLGLLDEPPPLLGGDHAGGGALKDADVILLFQIFQRLADVGLGRIQLLCRSAHRPPLHDGDQIAQFCNVQALLSFWRRVEPFCPIVSAPAPGCQVDGSASGLYNKNTTFSPAGRIICKTRTLYFSRKIV